MARRYSGSKGKSGSTKPSKYVKKTWVRYTPKEVELLILKMAKEGKSSSEIGLVLRDTYGIPRARDVVGKKILQILSEKKLISQVPEDVMALIRKEVAVRKHIDANKMDETAKRGLHLTSSKIK